MRQKKTNGADTEYNETGETQISDTGNRQSEL